MNLKKLLCSLLAIAMILSTMGISVLADTVPAISINGTEYATLAEALEKAADGDTITLNSPDTAIDAAGVVADDKTVTITGKALVTYTGQLYVGRGAEGNGTLIFDNAIITCNDSSGGLGPNISGSEKDKDTTNDGTLIIKNSTMTIPYFFSRGTVKVENSKLEIKRGFAVTGRLADETPDGNIGIATMDITDNSEVVVGNMDGMGVGYEGIGIVTLENSTFENENLYVNDDINGGNGSRFYVSGDVTVNVPNAKVRANGDVNFKGENTVAILPFNNGYTYTIGVNDSLAMTGTVDRPVIGHGATVNIEGDITNAKSVTDTSSLKPSLYIYKGASFTGEGLTFNVSNAYVVFGEGDMASSKNSAATGKFDFNIENSILECKKKLMFATPKYDYLTPEFNFNLTNSVLTGENYLQFSAEGCNTVIDNSIVDGKNQFENYGNFTLKEGSVMTVASVQTSSNATQPGTLTVDNATFNAKGTFFGRPNANGDMTGELILKNGANTTINGSIEDVFVTVDTSSTLATGSIIGDSTVTIDTANIALGKTKVLDLSESESREGNVTISPELTASGQDIIYGDDGDVTVDMYVAKIGDKTYSTLKEALAAATGDNATLTLYNGEYSITDLIVDKNANPYPYAKDLKIVGEGDVTFKLNSDENGYSCTNQTAYQYLIGGSWYACGDSIEFENIDFKFTDTNTTDTLTIGELQVFANHSIKFTKCNFDGVTVSPWGNNTTGKVLKAEIVECDFKNVATRSAIHQSRALDLKVDKCDFTDVVSGIHISGDNLVKLTVTGNTFTGLASDSAAIYFGDESWKADWTGDWSNAEFTVSGNTAKEQNFVRNRNASLTIPQLVAAVNKEVNNTYGTAFTTNSTDLVYVATIDYEKGYTTREAAIEAAGEGKTVILLGDITTPADDTYYLVPGETPSGKMAITFDFNGGTNAEGYVTETAYYNMSDSVNAPIAYRDGFIFAGWDADNDGIVNEVMTEAMSPATYKAIWFNEEEYGFKVTLTPTGGTMLEGEERSMKVNPSEYFLVEISVADYFNSDMAWNDADITLEFDNDIFEFVYGEGVSLVEGTDNQLRFRLYGEDRISGSVAKQISFKALNPGADASVNKSGVFEVTEATVDTGWAANRIDATEVRDALAASVYIFYSYDVTLGEGLIGSAVATTDADYVGEIKDYDDDYNYKVWVEREDGTRFEADLDGKNFTVNKEDITGNLKIELQLIGLKGVEADDIEIYEYITGKVALVLLNAVEDADRQYTYNNAIMYETPWYMTTASTTNKLYGYLVAKENFTLDANSEINTKENRELALSKIGIATDGRTNPEIENEPGDVNNANASSHVIDINDVQAVWNCYNGNDGEAINVNMPLYLRADICGKSGAARDKKVDSSDVNAVMQMVDLAKQGYARDYTAAKLATCSIDNGTGSTYKLSYTKGTEEVEVVKAESVSAKDDITAGHNFEAVLEGEGANTKYVIKCTNANCGRVKETIEITSFVKNIIIKNNQIGGNAEISTSGQLIFLNILAKEGKVGIQDNGGYLTYKLMNDIDLAGYEWYPLNAYDHKVVFDGNGFSIKNLSASSLDKSGLFGSAAGSTIKNLTLENVTAKGNQVGAFAGHMEGGKVVDCTLKGNINITWEGTPGGYGSAAAAVGVIVTSGSCSVTDAGATINVIAENLDSKVTLLDETRRTYVYGLAGGASADNIIITTQQ